MNLPSQEKEFRLIYEENYNSLCRVAYRILLDKESAREVVQEIFIDLWENGKWKELKSTKAYLYVAVYNRGLKALSIRKRFVSDELMPQIQTDDHLSMEYKEVENMVLNGISELPERCKMIFLLSREEEMTYKEISENLGLSIKTVERQMGIALQKLRNFFKNHS